MDLAVQIAVSNIDPVGGKGVGCVLVSYSGNIIGTGCRHTYHNFLGKLHKTVHAEHMALMCAMTENSDLVYKSIAYVTMEPCIKRWCHSQNWRMDACCTMLIRNGIKRVVIGSYDKEFGGGGVELLGKNGIDVEMMDLDLSFLVKNASVDPRVKNEYNESNFK